MIVPSLPRTFLEENRLGYPEKNQHTDEEERMVDVLWHHAQVFCPGN